jgi:peptide/nickel transport system substrate-binding protein
MAIDREAINQALFGGEGAVAWDLWPEGHRFHNPELDDVYAYDPDAARDLLADAGYPDGLTFDVIPIPVAGAPEVAQIVQQEFAEIGVTMNILATTNYVEDFSNRKLAPVGLVPSTGAGGIGKLRQWVGESVGNVCTYNDPELNALAQDLQSVSGETEEGVQAWYAVQEKVVGDALSIFVVFQPRVGAYSGDKLGGVESAYYPVPVPDVYEIYVKA